jgi:hypothetical protein
MDRRELLQTEGMNMTHTKVRLGFRAAILCAMTAPVVLFGSAYASQGDKPQGDKPQGDKPPTAARKFKNIQVLKSLPADQIVPVMHQWSLSLGVGCDFCHVVETTASGQHVGFEKDVKPEKAMARKMALMTMRLNKSEKLLDKGATCYMCHHGHAIPERKVPTQAPPTAR